MRGRGIATVLVPLLVGCGLSPADTAHPATLPATPAAVAEASTIASPARETPASATAEPSPTPVSTTVPNASPPGPTDFQYADILRVAVDGLAVREAPSLTSLLVQGHRAVEGSTEPTGDVRLDAGYTVSVHLGPLRSDDTDWYLVWPAVDGRLHYNPGPWWDSNGDFAIVGGVDPGWVAASVGADQYLTLFRRPEPHEVDPSFVMVSGTGDYESGPQPRHDLWGFNWAVAADNNESSCEFSATLVPEEGGAEPVLAVEALTDDVEQGPVTGQGSQISLPWGPSAGGSWDSFTVLIESGCNWVVCLRLHGHD